MKEVKGDEYLTSILTHQALESQALTVNFYVRWVLLTF